MIMPEHNVSSIISGDSEVMPTVDRGKTSDDLIPPL